MRLLLAGAGTVRRRVATSAGLASSAQLASPSKPSLHGGQRLCDRPASSPAPKLVTTAHLLEPVPSAPVCRRIDNRERHGLLRSLLAGPCHLLPPTTTPTTAATHCVASIRPSIAFLPAPHSRSRRIAGLVAPSRCLIEELVFSLQTTNWLLFAASAVGNQVRPACFLLCPRLHAPVFLYPPAFGCASTPGLIEDGQCCNCAYLSSVSPSLLATIEATNRLASPGTCLYAMYPTPPMHSTQLDARRAVMSALPTTLLLHEADSPTLKRAFSTPNSSFPSKKLEQAFTHCPSSPSTSPRTRRWATPSPRRCPKLATPTPPRQPSMVQTSARSSMPMPSFGSVFGEESRRSGLQSHAFVNGSNVVRPHTSGNTNIGAPFSSFHLHHDSRDSNSTASSDNSPTTTISTMDSSSVTDPSPGVSPESPLAKTITPSSFVADFRSRRTEPVSGDSSPNTFFELQRPTTPAKKPRNLKNLGINTASSLSNLRGQTHAPVAVPPKEKTSSAPPSPLFIKPPTPPKRRPSNLSLTISTPGSNEGKPVRLLIPSTPSFNRPALRHFQSSPSLPICLSANLKGPKGGMQLPPLRPITTKPSGLSEVPFEMEEEEDQEPNFDIPQSREEKPAAYPNGPICIYEAGVYLYFEPTAEQATTFDVIINVASEVKDPFLSSAPETQKDIDARRVDGPPAENVDFATLAQRLKPTSFLPESPSASKTAPAMKVTPPRKVILDGQTYTTPEYIHVPWEHNTDIVPDLYKLVKMMDDHLKQGRRVLIHCQCGVSRSASLIVAYGLYKDPQMSVQEAYDKAKKRSKWIGPNMNLIMQLQEFRNGLLRQNESRSYHNQGYGRRSAGLPTTRSTNGNVYSPFDRDAPSGSRTPQTAPLPPDSDISMQRASTGNIMAISPGPLSAPTGIFAPGFRRSWDSSNTHFDLSSQSTPTTTPQVGPKDQPVPTLSIDNNSPSVPMDHDSATELTLPDNDTILMPPSVPNFSRQLPLRLSDSQDEESNHGMSERHLAPTQTFGMQALRSPAVATFNIPRMGFQDRSYDSEVASPIKTSFSEDPWPQGYDSELQSDVPALNVRDMSMPLAPAPIRSTEINMTDFASRAGIGDSFLVPRTPFRLGQPPPSPRPRFVERPDEGPEVASPIATHFPKDVFGSADDVMEDEMKSPRATEFHMTPLKPRLAKDEDPFGLTSPTRMESAGNPFDLPNLAALKATEHEDRRPSFQAILPPAHQTFNGFASLDGTAQTISPFQAPVPFASSNVRPNVGLEPAADRSPKALEVQDPAPDHMSTPSFPKAPNTPQSPSHAFLSTPAKIIRTRFSSPNMRDQRKLHKLQTEIQSKLPKPGVAQHSVDDIDALMSPRAEEFTRNPFHFELHPAADESSPVSSNATIKDGRNGHDWSVSPPRQWTPEKAAVDPRSPVQTGNSPIVRNIWDVLSQPGLDLRTKRALCGYDTREPASRGLTPEYPHCRHHLFIHCIRLSNFLWLHVSFVYPGVQSPTLHSLVEVFTRALSYVTVMS
ncbi:hypothetical protein T440DRAFT_505137 [Plenodomus tracheiphilus IPT5]|uniref:protein-tyrosine-phosphatase n=1 Tax=Plenodomus tracheiphilus IPT5 TaxID=1408161 RepID=A0A6A7BI64_9PLEO|nr:hypothetical protein T440DRAFT_505137 [Plenodomus tracheiphilus IPT5]